MLQCNSFSNGKTGLNFVHLKVYTLLNWHVQAIYLVPLNTKIQFTTKEANSRHQTFLGWLTMFEVIETLVQNFCTCFSFNI